MSRRDTRDALHAALAREAKTIPCGYCNAPPGQGCVTNTGYPVQQPLGVHSVRHRHAITVLARGRAHAPLTDYG
jgi:hypothetical protein